MRRRGWGIEIRNQDGTYSRIYGHGWMFERKGDIARYFPDAVKRGAIRACRYSADQLELSSHAPLIHSGSGLEEPIVEVAKEKEL